MKEQTVYSCEICGGSYATKEVALKCEQAGSPQHYNEFLHKWILLPLQILNHTDTPTSSSFDSKVEWFLARVDSNQITSPNNYEILSFLKLTPIAHGLKITSSSFKSHFILKQFLKYAIIVDEKYYSQLNNLLVENEMNKINHVNNSTMNETLIKVQKLMDDIVIENHIEFPILEDVTKYEYKSSI